jgi:hypothetical protein
MSLRQIKSECNTCRMQLEFVKSRPFKPVASWIGGVMQFNTIISLTGEVR